MARSLLFSLLFLTVPCGPAFAASVTPRDNIGPDTSLTDGLPGSATGHEGGEWTTDRNLNNGVVKMIHTMSISTTKIHTLENSNTTLLHWCVILVVIAISVSCLTASGAQWRGAFEGGGNPSEPKTNSWFAFGGVWSGVPTGWNPRDPHGTETFYFSPEFVDLENGFPQTIVLGDFTKRFLDGTPDTPVDGDDAVTGTVSVNRGIWTFFFSPLFVSDPAPSSGSLTILGSLIVDGIESAPAMLTLSGAGSLTDGETTGISVDAGSFTVETATVVLSNDATAKIGGTLIVGLFSPHSVLEVNPGSHIVTNSSVIGSQTGSSGEVQISGTDSIFNTEGTLFVGQGGHGTLEILNSGNVICTSAVIANSTTGTAIVNGNGSKWMIDGSLSVGNFGTSNGTLTISGGGEVSNLTGYVGFFHEAIGTVIVNGAGSKWNNSGSLFVGNSETSNGTLKIESGGTVSSLTGYIGFETNSTGSVTVTGNNSKWENIGSLFVGVDGTASLTVSSLGTVTATQVEIGLKGELLGDGSVVGNSGLVNVTNGGLVSPGTSLGELSIDGNYTQTADGKLFMEISGPVALDRLLVSDQASLGGTLHVDLLGNYSPPEGATFDLFDWASSSGAFSTLELPSLAGNLAWNISQLHTEGVLSVTKAGDFDSDGDVDGTDFLFWQRSPSIGNLTDWQNNYGMTGSIVSAASIPEPSTLLLTSLAGLLCCSRIPSTRPRCRASLGPVMP